MGLTLNVAIYLVAWWIVLFAVLPWGITSQHEAGEYPEGTDPGAPVAPNLRKKMLWTTGIAFLVWAFIWVLVEYRLLPLDTIPVGSR